MRKDAYHRVQLLKLNRSEQIRICQQSINALSTLAEDEIVAYLEKSGAFWIKLSS